MKIEINGNCPHCGNEVKGITNMEVFGLNETEKLTMKIFQEASQRAHSEVTRKDLSERKEGFHVRYGSIYPPLRTYFDNYELQCKISTNPKVLKKMREEILKMKPRVTKEVKVLTEHYKKNVLALIDGRLKILTGEDSGTNNTKSKRIRKNK